MEMSSLNVRKLHAHKIWERLHPTRKTSIDGVVLYEKPSKVLMRLELF
jgi:hypothetical protein